MDIELTPAKYPDGRPEANLRLNATDHGIVLRCNDGHAFDLYGARDIYVFESEGKYYMHYDAAGPEGWLCALATSDNLIHWQKVGPVLELGDKLQDDSASASFGVPYYDDANKKWHLFYLGTPNVSPSPDKVPGFPYNTLKAESDRPEGPWRKRYDITPFRPTPHTYYDTTASPGQVIEWKGEYIQFVSTTQADQLNPNNGYAALRTLAIARTKDLESPWTMDATPIVPVTEQIENATLHYDETSKYWFLFTNHVGMNSSGQEYTDAIWVYWSKDPTEWSTENKAIALDTENCNWSTTTIGLPSVIKKGDRLALFYDATEKAGDFSHMGRHVGLAWYDLPLCPPTSE